MVNFLKCLFCYTVTSCRRPQHSSLNTKHFQVKFFYCWCALECLSVGACFFAFFYCKCTFFSSSVYEFSQRKHDAGNEDTSKSSRTFLMESCSLFLGSINIPSFFHLFLGKISNANFFFNANHTTLLVVFFSYFTGSSMHKFYSTHFEIFFLVFCEIRIFFISNRNKIKVFWFQRLFSLSVFYELNRSGNTFPLDDGNSFKSIKK